MDHAGIEGHRERTDCQGVIGFEVGKRERAAGCTELLGNFTRKIATIIIVEARLDQLLKGRS